MHMFIQVWSGVLFFFRVFFVHQSYQDQFKFTDKIRGERERLLGGPPCL